MAETFTLTRSFPHPREQVWAAWTRPEGFSMWFGGEEAEIPLETLHFRAETGEGWSATMLLPDGLRSDWCGEFIDVDAPGHLMLSIGDDPDVGASATVALDLVETADGTALTLTQAGDAVPEEAWGFFLDTMADHLDADAE